MPETTPEEIFNQFMEQQQAAMDRARANPNAGGANQPMVTT